MTDRKAFEAYVEFCNKVWQNKAIKADWGLNDVWQAATLAERERCAKVCDALWEEHEGATAYGITLCSTAIRKGTT